MNGKRFILLVEDSDDDALLFDRVVAKADLGVELRRVRNGQEAIDYILGANGFADRRQYPFPTIVMLDLKMPICDGFDFLDWKRDQPSLACLPTIVMTSSDFPGDVRRSYQLGAHSFTMKVRASDSVRERVEALREWWFRHCVVLPPAAGEVISEN